MKKAVILTIILGIMFTQKPVYAQNDVTQFLGIPVDGSKSEMIQKLKDKGFTTSPNGKDVLEGEFNGIEVRIYIVTNNNQVYRIMVSDANSIGETDIKIRFNKLLKQFQNNKRYSPLPDSTMSTYNIPENEDISFELSVKNKRYEAVFHQNSADYDSLLTEYVDFFKKDTLNDVDIERQGVIFKKMIEERSFLNKEVWFMISELSGKYYISIYYDNKYNRANGEGL
jgi:hypothetical protein